MDYTAFKKLPVELAIQEAAKYSGFSVDEITGVWNTESAMGSLVGQFHRYGLAVVEKPLGW